MKLLLAALTRPMNVFVPGAGLLFALASGFWWLFPLSLLPYGAMVWLSVRDPRFIERTLVSDANRASAIDWTLRVADIDSVELRPLLARIAQAEAKIEAQVDRAPPSLIPVLEASLEQVRSAANLGVDLARRGQDLDRQLAAVQRPDKVRADAGGRRERAAATTDPAIRDEYLATATALEETASQTEQLEQVRDRIYAQLDGLAAALESAVLRSMRIRVASSDDEENAAALSTALRVDVNTMRETLAVFEEVSVPAQENQRRAR